MSLFLRLALRNVFRNRTRTVVALLAIASGCAALIVNGGVIYDIFEELREDAIHGRHGHLQIYRSGYNEHYNEDPGRYRIPPAETERIVALLRASPHVEHVMPMREFTGLIASGDRYVAFAGFGVDPAADAAFSRHATLRAGEALSAEEPFGFVCGLGLAAKFAGQPGDVVTLMTNTDSGALNAVDVRLRGVFEGGLKAYDDWTLKLPLEAAADLLLDERVERILVLLDRTEALPAVRARLENDFRTAGLDLETRGWPELAEFHNQVVALFGRELDVIKIIIGTIVVLGIGNTIAMSLVERRVELATLRALGLGQPAIAALLLAESMLTGLVGGLLGVGFGWVVARVATVIGIPFPSPPGSTRPFLGGVDFVPEVVGFAFVLSVVATLLAAALPVWRAIRRPIAEGLRGA